MKKRILDWLFEIKEIQMQTPRLIMLFIFLAILDFGMNLDTLKYKD